MTKETGYYVYIRLNRLCSVLLKFILCTECIDSSIIHSRINISFNRDHIVIYMSGVRSE